jgi:thioredoxin reductase (NADPH)
MDANTTAISTKPPEGQPYDAIIIGSGPAGLTAAIYTTRGALSTLILGGTRWGGQLMLTSEVDNYPGFPEGIMGPDLMTNMRRQAERFGAVFLEKDVEKVDFKLSPFRAWADGQEYRGRSVIIATGAETKWLGIPSEQKLIGRGVSSCAPCDAPFFRDKNVFVIGGGDSAMEEALVLTKYASGVTIVHRRDSFRASQAMQQKVLNHPKIKVIWNSEVEEILGTDKVAGIRLKNVQTQELADFEAQGVFVAIGHSPSSKIF